MLHVSRLPLWTAGIVSALGVMTLSVLAHELFASSIAVKNVSNPSAIAPSKTDEHKPLTIEVVDALNLFGAKASDTAPDIDSLPTTTLNLKVAGIISSSQSNASRVFIAVDGKSAQSFFVGDKLSPDVTLDSIERDFVILQRGAQLEKLPLHSVATGMSMASRGSAHSATLSPAVALTTAPTMAAPATPQTVYRDLEDRLATIRQKK